MSLLSPGDGEQAGFPGLLRAPTVSPTPDVGEGRKVVGKEQAPWGWGARDGGGVNGTESGSPGLPARPGEGGGRRAGGGGGGSLRRGRRTRSDFPG